MGNFEQRVCRLTTGLSPNLFHSAVSLPPSLKAALSERKNNVPPNPPNTTEKDFLTGTMFPLSSREGAVMTEQLVMSAKV